MVVWTGWYGAGFGSFGKEGAVGGKYRLVVCGDQRVNVSAGNMNESPISA